MKPFLSLPDDHEVDVIGYGAGSDDDHLSVGSAGSANNDGVVITTWTRHLTLSGGATAEAI